jgi:DNA-binding transcriptional MerR regulator/effector-binding domain-containing protein
MVDPAAKMFSIGEFSRVTGITVKTLRFYHEEKLLLPTLIDATSGYRYYDPSLIERARAIVLLRELEFSLDQIKEMLSSADDSAALAAAMRKHKSTLEQRIRELRGVVRSLDRFLAEQGQETAMSQPAYEVQEKSVDPLLIAGVRMKGRYSDCGKGFAKIGRAFGRLIAGPCLLLHYDAEYKEDDADFEACMPVRSAKSVDGVSVRQLPAARCVCLVHKGPYDQLGPSYEKAIRYAKDKGYTIASPTREVYLKGPGMIFKGNPKNYVTEIQLPIG